MIVTFVFDGCVFFEHCFEREPFELLIQTSGESRNVVAETLCNIFGLFTQAR